MELGKEKKKEKMKEGRKEGKGEVIRKGRKRESRKRKNNEKTR